jgi:hypothetical protein
MTLVYIVSDVRSGSTLLDTILSQNDSITSIGEAHHFGKYFTREEGFEMCSCSRKIHDCEFWKIIIEELEKDSSLLGRSFATRFTLSDVPFVRIIQHLSLILLPDNFLSVTKFHRRNKVISGNRFTLVDKLRVLAPEGILLDSSKNPEAIPYLLGQKSCEVRIIHLVRDYRAVTHSKYLRSNGRMSFNKALVSTLIKAWIIKKYAQKVPSRKHVRINYEELVRRPDRVMNILEDFLGVTLDSIGQESAIELKEIHNLGGSPHRFNKRFKLVEDLKWKSDKQYLKFLKRLNLLNR